MSFEEKLRARKIKVVEEIIPHLVGRKFNDKTVLKIEHDSIWHHWALGLEITTDENIFSAMFYFNGMGPHKISLYPSNETIFNENVLANIVFENKIRL